MGWLIYGNIIFYDPADQCYDKAYSLWAIMLAVIIFGYCSMCKCCCLSMVFCVIIPMLLYAARQQQRPNWAPADNGILSNMVKTRFNVNRDGADKTCAICLENFQDDDEVVPLPCNPKHVFHEACISDWLRTNNVCPLCKVPVNKEALKNQRDNMA